MYICMLQLLMQPRMCLSFFAAKVHCWLKFNLLPNTTPRAFSAPASTGSWLYPIHFYFHFVCITFFNWASICSSWPFTTPFWALCALKKKICCTCFHLWRGHSWRSDSSQSLLLAHRAVFHDKLLPRQIPELESLLSCSCNSTVHFVHLSQNLKCHDLMAVEAAEESPKLNIYLTPISYSRRSKKTNT